MEHKYYNYKVKGTKDNINDIKTCARFISTIVQNDL